MKPFAPTLLAAVVIAAAGAPLAFAQVSQQDLALPIGGNCTNEIARYRAIQEQDHEMGHVAVSVYNKIKKELAAAEVACSAGQDAKAKSMVNASKLRHGYPTGL